MEKVYIVTSVFDLLAELQKNGVGCTKEKNGIELDVEKLKNELGRDVPIFVDALQETGNKLYPLQDEQGDSYKVEKVLGEIFLKTPEQTLSDAIQAIEETTKQQGAKEAGCVSTFTEVIRGSTTWKWVEEKCGEHLEVTRIQRVYNEYLSDQYESFKSRMEKKPGFDGVNEKLLFHGTGKTDPSLVCMGTEGFDPRLARYGNYGCGSYFSTTPNYSAKNYSYPVHTHCDVTVDDIGTKSVRQMVLGRVACGKVCDMKNSINQSLTRPPPISPENPYALYDSVQGGPFASRSSEMCMVVIYDKAQAMPDYLISFSFKSTFEEANRSQRRSLLRRYGSQLQASLRPKIPYMCPSMLMNAPLLSPMSIAKSFRRTPSSFQLLEARSRHSPIPEMHSNARKHSSFPQLKRKRKGMIARTQSAALPARVPSPPPPVPPLSPSAAESLPTKKRMISRSRSEKCKGTPSIWNASAPVDGTKEEDLFNTSFTLFGQSIPSEPTSIQEEQRQLDTFLAEDTQTFSVFPSAPTPSTTTESF